MMNYNEYKNSGSEWLGLIPSSWKVSSLKNFVVFVNGHSFKSEDYIDDGGVPIIRIGDINTVIDLTKTKKIDISKYNEIEKFKLKYNDILIALTGATIGKSGVYLSHKDAYLNQRVAILRTNEDLNQTFVRYFVGSDFFKEFIRLKCDGAAQENIGTNDIGNYKIAFPHFSEQTAIANFLDHQTSLIDTIISKKEKLIELLKEKRQAVINEAVTKGLDPTVKMKDSGIEWLGEIPEGWEVSSFKYYISLKGRLGWKGLKAEEYIENSGFGFLSTPDIKHDEIDYKNINNITEERYLESPEIMLENGDVLLVKDGSTLGISNIIKDLPLPTTVNSSIGVLKVFDKNVLNPDFLLLYLKTSYILSIIESLKAGQGVPHLFQKDINNFKLIVPCIEEQKKIVKKVSEQLISFELVNNNLVDQIEKLKQYRQSLISEAVTGKIDVREWKPEIAKS